MVEEHDETDGTLAHHLNQLAASADNLRTRLAAPHAGAEIHPEALGEATQLSTSLRAVVKALTHHEHLAMGIDDVWKLLSVEHQRHADGEFT